MTGYSIACEDRTMPDHDLQKSPECVAKLATVRQHQCLAVGATKSGVALRHAVSTEGGANARSRTGCNGRVGAKHTDTRPKFGSTERDHVLADVASDNLSMLGVGVSKNVLNEIVAVLVAGNVNEWDAWTVVAAFANTIKISTKKFHSANLEALFNNFGGKLVHAILRCIADDMVNSTATINRCSMLANVLNAPIAKLAVSNDVDTSENFFDAGALQYVSMDI
jgi:hypothetical protein